MEESSRRLLRELGYRFEALGGGGTCYIRPLGGSAMEFLITDGEYRAPEEFPAVMYLTAVDGTYGPIGVDSAEEVERAETDLEQERDEQMTLPEDLQLYADQVSE